MLGPSPGKVIFTCLDSNPRLTVQPAGGSNKVWLEKLIVSAGVESVLFVLMKSATVPHNPDASQHDLHKLAAVQSQFFCRCHTFKQLHKINNNTKNKLTDYFNNNNNYNYNNHHDNKCHGPHSRQKQRQNEHVLARVKFEPIGRKAVLSTSLLLANKAQSLRLSSACYQHSFSSSESQASVN